LEVGKTLQFKAEGRDQYNNGMSVGISWSSSSVTVGTIDNRGIFTAKGAGSTSITARNGSITSTAIVMVRALKPSIKDITGHSDGVGVLNGKWTGQPNRAPKWASNKYVNYYAIESQNNYYFWLIKGSAFGKNKGSVSFSTPNISSTIINWQDNEIRIIPKVTYSYTYNPSVTLTVRTSDGQTDTKSIPTVAIIQSRGYGQCTWFVANQRLSNSKTIPTKSYSISGKVNKDYIPQQWDALVFGSDEHVAIITSKVVSKVDKSKDYTITTYSFTVSEMNAKWDEAQSSYGASFAIKVDKQGNKAVNQDLKSSYSTKVIATGYWRCGLNPFHCTD
jgi:hypothetical protein